MKRQIAALGGSLAAMSMLAGAASAQGYGHQAHAFQVPTHGYHAPKAHVCYEKVVTHDVYGTVKKKVVKKEGYWETKEYPAEYGEVQKQVLVKAGKWEFQKEPAVYATKERNVLVEPEKTTIHLTPPEFKIEQVAHKVHTGYGHEKTIVQQHKVLVKPAQKHAETKPAVYKTEAYQVLVKPEHVTKIWHKPVYETKVEKVIVKPAYQQKIYHPPVFDFVEEKVLVKKGHEFTRPVWKKYGEAC
jgi:hypothetical protein